MLSRLWISTTLWIRHCRNPHFTVGSQHFRGKVHFQGHIMYMRKSHDSNSFECQCLSLFSQCILLPNMNFSLIVKTLQKVVFSQFSNFPVSSLSIPSTLGYCFCKRWSLYTAFLPITSTFETYLKTYTFPRRRHRYPHLASISPPCALHVVCLSTRAMICLP